MPAPTAHPTTDPVLAAEQAHLDHARDELRRMRESAESLDVSTATDAFNAAYLDLVLARRVASLQDDPRTTLFFGRIDCRTEHGAETFHVGRRHVSDDHGDPVVVDWRAPISTSFYRASPSEPMGVELRRRFGVDRGHLTAYEDERLTGATGDAADHSAILAAEIERPRSGPMRDIVSTIQPEQDEIVRSDLATSICVQGAPGTGKTAVGLHRAAWLLYSFRSQLDRSGVLVVGPNRAFLDHIGAVLPSLGEVRVRHATIDTLLGHGRVRAVDPTEVAILKGDARMARVLHAAVWGAVRRAEEALVVPRGSRRWRVPAHEVQDELDGLVQRGVRYSAARDLLPQRLAHRVMLQIERSGDFPGDRAQDALARSAPIRSYAKHLWPAHDPASVLFRLLSDPVALAEAADGILTGDEQRLLRWPAPPRSRGAAGGPRPTWPCSTSSPTSSTAPRAWGTSCSTRRRTSPPCSCARSGDGRPPGPSPSSATSPRARRPGRPTRGRRRWAISAGRRTSSSCSTAGSGSPASSSTSRPGCCPRWPRASAPPCRCATTPVGSP